MSTTFPPKRLLPRVAGSGVALWIVEATMGDVVSEVLPHLETFFHDHCLIVFPSSMEKELAIYYREYVGEISFSESQCFYSVRPRTGLGYTALGSEQTLSGALNQIYIILGALRKQPQRAA